MSEFEEEVKEALGGNGSFDPGKAKNAAKAASETFSTQLRRVERITWGYVIFFAALIAFSVIRFWHASSVRDQLMYLGLFLLAVGGQTLIKLWYWVVNNKLAVLKEMKLLRLDMQTVSGFGEATGPAAEKTAMEPRTRESIAWLAVAVVVAVAAVSLAMPMTKLHPDMILKNYVSLETDGGADVAGRMWFKYQGPVAMPSFDLYGQLQPAATKWFDARGREMNVTFHSGEGWQKRTIHMVEPLLPGDEFNARIVADYDSMAVRDGDLWVMKMSQSKWGFRNNRFEDTVLLPAGAELVSAEPKPDGTFTRLNRTGLRFTGTCSRKGEFKYTIKYHLNTEAAEPAADSPAASNP